MHGKILHLVHFNHVKILCLPWHDYFWSVLQPCFLCLSSVLAVLNIAGVIGPPGRLNYCIVLDCRYNFKLILSIKHSFVRRWVIACPKVSPKYSLEELHHNRELFQRPVISCLNKDLKSIFLEDSKNYLKGNDKSVDKFDLKRLLFSKLLNELL